MLAAAADSPSPSPEFQLRYRVVEELGRGGLGVTYRAVQVERNREVALKFPPVERADRKHAVVTEASLLADLIHPNIVRYFDAGFDDGRPYVATELVRGITLSAMLQRAGRLDVSTAVLLVCQICDGLAVAHERGIVHRDIRPGNVLVQGGSIAKLSDFGLGTGAPAYLAPECVQGQPPDARCDLYAVGVTLFELLTGQVPFASDDPHDVLTRQIVEPAPRLAGVRPDVPPGVDELVARLLAKRPAERPRSASYLAIELRRALAPPPPATSVLADMAVPSSPANTGWVMMAAMVGLAGAALSIGLVLALAWATGAGP